ncbi:hypothetical protein [Zemynaea arenosa]|uniref:hypothetical protein n=1 Tax=Zemynaea arenosa TaxID=2561931 RepID=UPI001431B8CB|nr:hypothetical protein [Massilia arenosa]
MAQSKSGGSPSSKQSTTEADVQAGDNKAKDKSSRNHMSTTKAGKGKGAGGGAKQKEGR